MTSTYSKILVVILIVLGEALAIYAEVLGAKDNNLSLHSFWQIFFKMLLVFTLAGGFLITGYMLGFKAFQNIWVVSVTSITSILIVEPIMAVTIFQQTPTAGAIVGFILGAIGLFVALYF
jgi:hypothetical protein